MYHVLSHIRLFASPWTVARQTPLPVGFPRQEYRSDLPFPPVGDLSGPATEPVSPVSLALQIFFLPAEPSAKPKTRWKSQATKNAPKLLQFSYSSVSQSCLTLCDPMDCSTLGLPVHHQLPEFT